MNVVAIYGITWLALFAVVVADVVARRLVSIYGETWLALFGLCLGSVIVSGLLFVALIRPVDLGVGSE